MCMYESLCVRAFVSVCVYVCLQCCEDVRWRVGGKEELNDNLTFNVINLFIAFFLLHNFKRQNLEREVEREGKNTEVFEPL